MSISNDPGDIFRAEEELRRVLKEDPQSAMGHAMLGAVHFFQGQIDLAGDETLRAVRLAPGDMGGEMWFLLRERLLGNEVAMREARRLTESEPLFWPARYLQAELLREQGKTAEAVREHQKVLEQDPQNSTALRCLARVSQYQSDRRADYFPLPVIKAIEVSLVPGPMVA